MSVLLPFSILGAPGDDALDVADVFSTDLYTGNGSTQTITNGIDLSGEGGLVWIKNRGASGNHVVVDSERGDAQNLTTNTSDAEIDNTGFAQSLTSSGFSLPSGWVPVNANSNTYVGWSFRRAPKFFDVVVASGTGSAQTLSHNLGSVPGLIIGKRLDSSGNWRIYHRSLGVTQGLAFTTGAAVTATSFWNDTAPTDTQFTIGTDLSDSGTDNFIFYLFAHDTSDSGIIQCGSYTGNGSASGPTVTLGWEPQWLLVKQADAGRDWYIMDSARNTFDNNLRPNVSDAENTSVDYIDVSGTGFSLVSNSAAVNASSGTYIYMAIKAEGA